MANSNDFGIGIIEAIDSTKFRVLGPDGVSRMFTLGDIFDIDSTDITSEFMRQPALYAYFAAATAAAERASGRAEFKKDQEYAISDMASREQMERNGQKYTEAVIRSMALADQVYTDAVESELTAKYDYKLLKALTSALEQRAQMLISIGSQLRHEESTTGMAIRDQQFDKTARDTRAMLDKKRKSA